MAKVRVHELAKEYGVESRIILAKLTEMGLFVKSASSTVEPQVVKRFTDRYGDELRQRAKSKAAHHELGKRPNPFSSTSRDPGLAEAAAMLGVPVHELRPARDARPRQRRHLEPQGRQLTSWDEHFFTREERRTWQKAGLGPDGRLAAELARRGVNPSDLAVRIRGRRVVERIRGGEPVAMVVRELGEVKPRQTG